VGSYLPPAVDIEIRRTLLYLFLERRDVRADIIADELLAVCR
jgi:hypothetical protein